MSCKESHLPVRFVFEPITIILTRIMRKCKEMLFDYLVKPFPDSRPKSEHINRIIDFGL